MLNSIKNLDHRNEIVRILKNPDAQDQERLWLVSFLRDKVGLNELQICDLIKEENRWLDYKVETTAYNVNRIFERKAEGFLPSGSQAHSKETQCGGKVKEGGSRNLCGFAANMQRRVAGFHNQRKQENDQPKGAKAMKELKTFAKVENGTRYYKLSQKEGDFGKFYSLDSGEIVETLDNQRALARPDRFFSLPKDKEILKTLAEGLNEIAKETTGPSPKK